MQLLPHKLNQLYHNTFAKHFASLGPAWEDTRALFSDEVLSKTLLLSPPIIRSGFLMFSKEYEVCFRILDTNISGIISADSRGGHFSVERILINGKVWTEMQSQAVQDLATSAILHMMAKGFHSESNENWNYFV